MLAGLGGANQPRQKLFVPGRLGYMDGCPPASYLPAERVKMLDEWGVNAGVLFPTVGILWDVEDNELAAAYARAYNNWINDFASARAQPRDSDRAYRAAGRGLARWRSSSDASSSASRESSSRPKTSAAGASRILTSIRSGANAKRPAFRRACT